MNPLTANMKSHLPTLPQFHSAIHSIIPKEALFFCCTLYLLSVIYNIFFSPYRHIPRPLISKTIPIYDLYFMLNGMFHLHLSELHDKYGEVVKNGKHIYIHLAISLYCLAYNAFRWKLHLFKLPNPI